jgi:hypothetical protein
LKLLVAEWKLLVAIFAQQSEQHSVSAATTTAFKVLAV